MIEVGGKKTDVKTTIGDAAETIDKSQTTNNYGVSIEQFQKLAGDLAVTESALANFFRILEEAEVPAYDLDAKLREIAHRHKDLLEQLEHFVSDDPEVIALKEAARAALEEGDHATAAARLEQARDLDLTKARAQEETARSIAEVARKRYLSAAESEAERGEMAQARLKYAEAAVHFRKAAELVPETEKAVRARYLNDAGFQLRQLARNAEAEPLYLEALKLRQEVHGEDHTTVAESLNNLAALYQATNRLAEAEPLMQRALAIDEAAYGPEHPKVARDLNNLAQLYQTTNRLAEAEPLFERALAIDEAAFGPEHPKVAIRLNNLAGLYTNTDRLAEAEPLFERALAIDEADYGPEHPNVAIDLNNLASLYQVTSRLTKAERLFERALAIFTASLGEDHPNTQTVADNLAILRAQMAQAAKP